MIKQLPRFFCPNSKLKPSTFEWSIFKEGIKNVPLNLKLKDIPQLDTKLINNRIYVDSIIWNKIIHIYQKKLQDYETAYYFIQEISDIIDLYEIKTSRIKGLCKKKEIDQAVLSRSLTEWKAIVIKFFSLGYIDEVIEIVGEIYLLKFKQLAKKILKTKYDDKFFSSLISRNTSYEYTLANSLRKLQNKYIKGDKNFDKFLDTFIFENYIFVFYLCKEYKEMDEYNAMLYFLKHNNLTPYIKKSKSERQKNKLIEIKKYFLVKDWNLLMDYYNLIIFAQDVRDYHAPRQLAGIYIIKKILKKILNINIETLTINNIIKRIKNNPLGFNLPNY